MRDGDSNIPAGVKSSRSLVTHCDILVDFVLVVQLVCFPRLGCPFFL